MLLLILSLVILITQSPSSDAVDEVRQYCNFGVTNGIAQKGLCISFENRLKNCPPLKKLLIEKRFGELRGQFCDEAKTVSEISWVKACCPLEDLIEEETHFESHPNFKLIPHPQNSVCGQKLSQSDRIIGGNTVLPGSLPWIARMGTTRDGDFEFTCGGSIISSRYILSAAHCFKDPENKLTMIRLGETNSEEEKECIPDTDVCINEADEDYEPEKVIIHPGYDGSLGSKDDIALIRLSKEIKNPASVFTRPICLPLVKDFNLPKEIKNTTKIYVAGWGKLRNSDSDGSPTLQEVYVSPQHNIGCNKVFKANNITIAENKQLCAGGDKGKGSCKGDSGGPLAVISGTTKKAYPPRDYQIGIVSFGKTVCGSEDSPVVYTRVRKYIKWILDNMEA